MKFQPRTVIQAGPVPLSQLLIGIKSNGKSEALSVLSEKVRLTNKGLGRVKRIRKYEPRQQGSLSEGACPYHTVIWLFLGSGSQTVGKYQGPHSSIPDASAIIDLVSVPDDWKSSMTNKVSIKPPFGSKLN